jgi:hypothetical protein
VGPGTHRAGFGLALCMVIAASAFAEESSPKPTAPDSTTEQVTVSAQRIDRGILDRIVIPRFVESHGKPGERINQVARWRTPVCPETLGFTPQYDDGISRHVVEVARSAVLAPVASVDPGSFDPAVQWSRARPPTVAR